MSPNYNSQSVKKLESPRLQFFHRLGAQFMSHKFGDINLVPRADCIEHPLNLLTTLKQASPGLKISSGITNITYRLIETLDSSSYATWPKKRLLSLSLNIGSKAKGRTFGLQYTRGQGP